MIDGPIPIMSRGPDGELTDTPAPGVHYNVCPDLMAQRPDLEAYRVTPPVLQRVWAGDDPADPEITVALRFEDEAAADAALFPQTENITDPDA